MKRRSLWDLIDDERTGRIQTTKVWLHIGNAFATYKFFQIPAGQLTYDLLAMYLGIVTGSYAGLYYLTGKRGQNAVDTNMDTGAATLPENGGAGGLVADSGVDNAPSGQASRSGKKCGGAKKSR